MVKLNSGQKSQLEMEPGLPAGYWVMLIAMKYPGLTAEKLMCWNVLEGRLMMKQVMA